MVVGAVFRKVFNSDARLQRFGRDDDPVSLPLSRAYHLESNITAFMAKSLDPK